MENDQDAAIQASMVPPTPEPQNTQVSPYACSQSSNEIERMLSQALNLNADNVFHEPTCLICSNPHREDLEKKWAENQRAGEVKALFESKSSARISVDIVENHMNHHFNKGGKEQQKLEYINKIKRLSDSQSTTLDRIKLGLATITERLMGVNSITPDNNLSAAEVERVKTTETAKLMMAFNQLCKLQASIMGEMKDNGELITIPKDAFVSLCRKAIVEAKTDGERKCINKLLSDLADLSKKVQ